MLQSALPFNLLDPQFLIDPFPTFDKMRETAPLYWFEPMQFWYLTRHDDVAAAFKDTRRFSSARIQMLIASQVSLTELAQYAPLASTLEGWMVLQDPPVHTRLRSLVAKAFTPRMIEQLRPGIEAVVAKLLDRVQGAGHMDLVREFADGIPIAVISQMLGVPESDWPQLKEWTDEFAAFVSITGQADAAKLGQHGAVAICDYCLKLIEDRRRHPRSDFLSALITAASDPAHPVSDQELASSCFLLLSAGHETAETLIASAADQLLRHPTELQKLRADPSLLKGAMEEVLRYEPPLYSQGRIMTEDVEIRGCQLKKGQFVMLSMAAANRDPAVFPDPHRFDITRKENPHLSFAVGPHHCLGANLGRMEASIAIEALLRRLPDLRIAQEVPEFKAPSLMLHQLRSLAVSF